MPLEPALVWFRLDLRLADNDALRAAVDSGSPIIPVFLWSPEEERPWSPGAASCWWLHQSLQALEGELAKRGSRLIVRSGPVQQALLAIAAESGARNVYWNRRYEPPVIARDRNLKTQLAGRGLVVHSSPGNLLFEPWTMHNSSGGPFQVFTAFWKACLAEPEPKPPHPAPRTLLSPAHWPSSLQLSDLALEPRIDWAEGIRESWTPGEKGALRQVRSFVRGELDSYIPNRDLPGQPGTSRLSPHLHFGEITPRQVWHDATGRSQSRESAHDSAAVQGYLREIAWREFAHHLLYHFPRTPQECFHPEFRNFPSRKDARLFRAWTRGETGYPIVDAGMRELWRTGWMHNRVRMVTASFLIKDLLIPWQQGAEWFWDTLVDADLANNTMGWQWTAGCGADAAPYFRVFNPVLQGEKFDPEGLYVRRWVPELARLPKAWIHKPWSAPELLLSGLGVKLGVTYPRPVIDHDTARKRALAAYSSLKRG